ncbi:WxL domain-containing protein [Vagococcus xieshaowenii]|uniref:WxL domain-containing protein n=1 Tax=Vagococcus xieshaowenii TaxID=2562451 RepID=A0AAJ5ED62_9ENTE|nr:WxL domain-containing protein [Vagococcus xieshaowenii]QCA28951.1 WxL domain-containing protein [Vagococcus xieshaowenii]TFZ39237.1 WxL domain-containing protein [Vagococcus xieshaowenii]
MLKTNLLFVLTLLLIPSSSLAEEKSYSSKGQIDFVQGDDVVSPIDPENPDPDHSVVPWDPTNPDGHANIGTQGPLSIDYVSSFDFGANEISNQDTIYYANPQYYFNEDGTQKSEAIKKPNYVQISDFRGNNSGWCLTVKQSKQFTNNKTKNSMLIGAQVSLLNSQATSYIEEEDQIPEVNDIKLEPGETRIVMKANSGQGTNTWINSWNPIEILEDGVVKNTGIQLFIPGATPKDSVKYTTEFIWTLSDIPFE